MLGWAMDRSLAATFSFAVKDFLKYCSSNEDISRACGRADHVQVWSLLHSVLSRIITGNANLQDATQTDAALPPVKSRSIILKDFISVFREL
jgi:hypothetical protein